MMTVRSEAVSEIESTRQRPAEASWAMRTYRALDWLTRRWWFYVLLALGPWFIPPINARGNFGPSDVGPLVWELTDIWVWRKGFFEPLMPFLHLLIALLIFAVVKWGNRVRWLLPVAITINVTSLIYFQGSGITPSLGFVIVTVFATWFLAASLPWLLDLKLKLTDYTFRKLPLWRYWVVPFAVFAFWDPDQTWDFDPSKFLYSAAPTAICMMAPIYLSVYSLLYPKVNMPAFRLMSFTGITFAILTIGVGVFKGFYEGSYWTLVHTPMLFISTYCFILGIRRPREATLQPS